MSKLAEKLQTHSTEVPVIDTIGPSFVAATAGTIGFGALWGMIAVNHQSSQMWPLIIMGAISAIMIRLFAIDGVTRRHQIIALLAVLIGFLVVKYILFFGNLKMFFQQEYSHKMSVELAAVSAGAFISFIDSAKDQFRLTDWLWLSAATALVLFITRHSFQWAFRIRWPRMLKTIPQKS